MMEFKTKMNENGRIVVPVKIREQLGFLPGDELILRVESDELHISSVKSAVKRAQALVKSRVKVKSLVTELFKMRKEDQEK